MTKEYDNLHDIVVDSLFPEIDVKLRMGWHCDEEDTGEYSFITLNYEWLAIFYENYGAELIRASEGFYYLRPGSRLFRAIKLRNEEMVVAHFLALMKMDPQYLETSGYFDLNELLSKIELLLGENEVARVLLRKKRVKALVSDADVTNIRQALKRVLKELSKLGFVTYDQDFTKIYPRKPIFRFLDPLKGIQKQTEALEQVIKGENPFEDDTERNQDDD
jgi:chromosome partition protein MukE